MHKTTRAIKTEAVVTDGKSLSLQETVVRGFEWWAAIDPLATSYCGGDYEGRYTLPRGSTKMIVHHEAVFLAAENASVNGYSIKAGRPYAGIPGRRTCIENP